MLDKYLTEANARRSRRCASRSADRRLALKIVPVLAGSAFKNKGIQPLLDAVVDYLPSPVDVPPVEGTDPDTDEAELRRASDDQPFAALAFKIMSDPFVGHVTYIRVYSGVLEERADMFTTPAKDARAHRPLAAHAREQARRDRIDLSGRYRRLRGTEERQRPATRCATKRSRSFSKTSIFPPRLFPWPSSRKPKPTAARPSPPFATCWPATWRVERGGLAACRVHPLGTPTEPRRPPPSRASSGRCTTCCSNTRTS